MFELKVQKNFTSYKTWVFQSIKLIYRDHSVVALIFNDCKNTHTPNTHSKTHVNTRIDKYVDTVRQTFVHTPT